jgi:hypothetical protein
MPQPEYRALAARRFAVLVPERLGHGATLGRYLEDGGKVDFRVLAPSGSEGHRLAETETGENCRTGT